MTACGLVLDDNGMLQTDATILAGLLILLTLLSFKEDKVSLPEQPSIIFPAEMSLEEKKEKQIEIYKKYIEAYKEFHSTVIRLKRIRDTLSIVTIGGIVPFSLSAIFIILGFGTYWGLARYAMVAGFAYLIFGVALLVITYRKVTKLPKFPVVQDRPVI